MVETAGAGAGAVSWQCAGILLGLGQVKPAGFADCAHTFVRINLYAQDHGLILLQIVASSALESQ